MSAKEEHAKNVEIHKMRKQYIELTKQNAVLEAECASLRIATKDAFDKCSTMRDTLSKQYTDKMNEMQTEFENEKKRLNEQAHKDASTQRARHLDSFNDIKRQLESIYNAKMDENTATHEALMQQLKTDRAAFENERDRTRRETEEQLAQLSADRQQAIIELEEARQQVKRELDELNARIKQDEQEHIVRLLLKMDSEREQMKCQLKEERKDLVERLEREDIEKRQRTDNELEELKKRADDELAELKKRTDDELAERRNELEAERDILRQKEESLHEMRVAFEDEVNKKEEKEIARHNVRLQELKKKEEEQLAKINDELKRLKQLEDEQKQWVSDEIKRIHAEQAQMKKEVEEEREQLKKNHHEHKVKLTQECEHKYNARVAENNEQHKLRMQQLNNEREQVKQTMEELHQKKRENDEQFNARLIQQRNIVDATIRSLNDERDALKETDSRREREHAIMIKEMKSDRDANADAFSQKIKELDAKHILATKKLNDEREAEARANAYALAQKIKELEAKHISATKKLNDEREADAKANAHALAQKMKELDAKHILAMQKLNDERDALKEADLRRESEHAGVIKEMKSNREADAKANAEALAQKMKELDAKHILAMQKLNDDRDALKEADLRREREHMDLLKVVKLERIETTKANADALAQKTRELDVKFNVAMQKLNDDRDALKEADLRRERERIEILKEMKSNREADAKANADTHAQKMKELDAKYNLAMQKLNDDRDALKEADLRREREHIDLMKAIKLERIENAKANAKANADMLLKSKVEQESKLNAMVQEQQITFDNEMQKLMETFTQKNKDMEIKTEKTQQLRAELKKVHKEMLKDKDTLEKEKQLIAEGRCALEKEKQLIEEDRANLVKEQNEFKTEKQCQYGLTQALIVEIEQLNIQRHEEQETHVKIQNRLKKSIETNKPLITQLNDTIAANLAHMQIITSVDFKDKRVAIYSHYSNSDEVESYNNLTVECIQHYFDHIIILTNCPNKWNMRSPNYNKLHLLNYNMKSDFRNYGVFMLQVGLNLLTASCVCLLNDSFVVVDVNAFGRCIKRVFENDMLSYDFIGLTSSHENVFHIQSYFLHFNAPTLNHVVNYFKEQGLPINHDEAISKYELGLTTHLIEHGFSQFTFVSNDDMRFPLNTTCVKWSEVLNEIGIIKRQHFLKKYAYKSMSDIDIAEVAEKYSYNKHFINFLKYNNIKYMTNDK
jgi:hypothetical protein